MFLSQLTADPAVEPSLFHENTFNEGLQRYLFVLRQYLPLCNAHVLILKAVYL